MKVSNLFRATAALSISALISSHLSAATPLVVAYAYAGTSPSATTLQYDKLTHINIAFKNPDSNGELSFTASDRALVTTAHARNVQVFMSLGGAASANSLLNLYKNWLNNTNRPIFVRKIKEYLIRNNVDGIDVDIEGPGIKGVVNYGLFISELSAALKPVGKGLTAALSVGYGGADVPDIALSNFDFINIMSYDATGSWSKPGQHAPISQANSNITYWKNRNQILKNNHYTRQPKLVLGVPFYGYGWKGSSYAGAWTYKNIASISGAETKDVVTDSSGNVIYYNGIPTIQAKARLVGSEQLAGMMIWEINGDAAGSKSLLSAMHSTLRGITPPPTSNVAPLVNAGADKVVALSSANTVTIALAGTVTDADGDATTKLWTKVSGPGAVTFSSPGLASTSAAFSVAGTYVLRLAADDAHGHIVNDSVQVVINPYIAPPTTAFTRRINMNGAATTISGNAWISYSNALGQGLTVAPTPRLSDLKNITPSPVVDANTKTMLNSAIWDPTALTISHNVPNGNYSVSLWVMENYATNHRSFNVKMEGITLTTNGPIGLMAYGAWKKYTYSTTVKDGQLNIGLTKVTGEPGITGLEIVSVSSIAALNFENILGSWNQSATH